MLWHDTRKYLGAHIGDFNLQFCYMCLLSLIHTTGDKPKLQDLDVLKLRDGREVRIIENVAANWEYLAIRFGFEETRISNIKRGAFFQPEDACLKMFIRWLNGEHDLAPPTWYNLIQCLEETNKFLSLAKDVMEAIMLKRGMYNRKLYID